MPPSRPARRVFTRMAVLAAASAMYFGPLSPSALAQNYDGLNMLELQSLGGFALQGDPTVRAVLTGHMDTVALNYYGKKGVHFSATLEPDPKNPRDLIGAWRVNGGYHMADVRVTVFDDRRAVRVVLENPDFSWEELADYKMGTFEAEKLGGNWSGKDLAGLWRTTDGELQFSEGGTLILAHIRPKEGPARRFVSRTWQIDADNRVTIKGPWEAVDGSAGGDMTLRFSADRYRFEAEARTASGAVTTFSGVHTAATPVNPAEQAKKTWPGHYLSSEGVRVIVKSAGGMILGNGRGNDGLLENFSLTPADTAAGEWRHGATIGRLEGSLAQSPERLEFRNSVAGQTRTYRLCRSGAQDSALHYLGLGLWVEIADNTVSKEADGSHTLYVKARVLNAGDARRITTAEFTAELPDIYPSTAASAYYNPASHADDAPNPNAMPCSTLSVTFRFRNVTSKHRTFTFNRQSSRIVFLDVSDVTSKIGPDAPRPQTPGPQQPVPQTPQQPVPQQPVPQPQTPADDFQPLGKWDVRVDKIENPREDRLTHVYVTLRNAGTQNLLQTEDVWVYLEDTSGATQRSGQGLRAIPGPPQLFGSPPPVVLPGKTIQAKFIFDRVKGASITKVTVAEGDARAEYDF